MRSRGAAFFGLILLLCLSGLFCLASAENVVPTANSDPTYKALRDIHIGNESVKVSSLDLRRDAGMFRFSNGTFYFLEPVAGKVTGAVFVGEGRFVLEPSSAAEKRSVSLLTKSNSVDERFNVAVLRFTDNSYEEIKKAGTAGTGGDTGQAAKALSETQDRLRSDRLMRYNLSARILQDVLATSPSGLFFAFIHGQNFDGREVFALDPQGVSMLGLSPEEVAFATLNENKYGIWYSGHLASEDPAKATGTQMNSPIDIQKQVIDAQLEKSGKIVAKVTTTLAAVRPGMRVIPLNLFRHFRVEGVTDAAGQQLPFVMEEVSFNENEGDDEGNFNVILPKPLAAGETVTFTTVYGGTKAVSNEGGGNYFPIARDDWYPASRMSDYAEYEMTLRVPKGMKVAATGQLVKDSTEGNQYVTQWKTESPITVAGFNFGRFKVIEQKTSNGTLVQAFANEELPDWAKALKREAAGDNDITMGPHASEFALGSMETTGLIKKPLAEGQLAIQIYTNYFGPASYNRVALTQQSACNFGQAWPGLVWLPICAFFDGTVRHQLGIDDTRQPYWNVVAAHEVAHQWWGHTVGWGSYRDQWMSEGFAQLSASIYLQAISGNKTDQYMKFWKSLQDDLFWKNRFGYRPVDLGPVTQGFRINNTKSGSAYQELAYGKGAFVLHMLRMMMWDKQTGDQLFRDTMRDFVQTYRNRAASTEDFKAIVEKHMTPQMDIDGNHKMDWFFNEWVYGSEAPNYDFSYDLGKDDKGTLVTLRLRQNNVSDNFKMLVPLYAELNDGRVTRLGEIRIFGKQPFEQKVSLGNLQAKRFMINYYYDVLSGQ